MVDRILFSSKSDQIRPALLLLASISWAFFSLLAVANNDAEVAEKERQLEQVRSEIQSISQKLESKQRSQTELESQLKSLELSLNKQAKSVRKLKRQTTAVRSRLKRLHKERYAIEQTLATHQKVLVTQLRTAYYTGNQENLKLLLNQQDPSALARIIKYYDYLNQARLESIQLTESALRKLAETEQSITDNQSELISLLDKKEAEYAGLTKTRQKHKKLLSKLDSEIKAGRLSISSLRRDETHIQELIASLRGLFSDIPPEITSSVNFAELKGKLTWPTAGQLLNSFGEKRAQSDLIWHGVRIKATPGTDVRSISHGRVAFADWLPGFGLILIIDHHNGFISLYGYNEALYKETGDWVNADEVVASVGQGLNEQQSALYFEIRQNGKPINPTKWCSAKRG